jgi:hypothetical protein
MVSRVASYAYSQIASEVPCDSGIGPHLRAYEQVLPYFHHICCSHVLQGFLILYTIAVTLDVAIIWYCTASQPASLHASLPGISSSLSQVRGANTPIPAE